MRLVVVVLVVVVDARVELGCCAMWLRRLLWADGGTLALALETKGRGCWPRTMAASVCLFVCVSVTRLREPRLPCIADVRVLLVIMNRQSAVVDESMASASAPSYSTRS